MFWLEVLGKNFYLDEGMEDYDPSTQSTVEIEDWYLRYQGGAETWTNPLVRPNEYDTNPNGLVGINTGLETLFDRWKEAQVCTFVVAKFVVPKGAEADALIARLKEMGAELKTT